MKVLTGCQWHVDCNGVQQDYITLCTNSADSDSELAAMHLLAGRKTNVLDLLSLHDHMPAVNVCVSWWVGGVRLRTWVAFSFLHQFWYENVNLTARISVLVWCRKIILMLVVGWMKGLCAHMWIVRFAGKDVALPEVTTEWSQHIFVQTRVNIIGWHVASNSLGDWMSPGSRQQVLWDVWSPALLCLST